MRGEENRRKGNHGRISLSKSKISTEQGQNASIPHIVVLPSAITFGFQCIFSWIKNKQQQNPNQQQQRIGTKQLLSNNPINISSMNL